MIKKIKYILIMFGIILGALLLYPVNEVGAWYVGQQVYVNYSQLGGNPYYCQQPGYHQCNPR